MLVLSVRVKAPDCKRDEILSTLRSLIGPASAEPKCMSCRVFQDHDDPNAITLAESWVSRDDLERHVKVHQFKKLLAVIDLSELKPEIRIDGISPEQSGLEVLKRLQPDHANPLADGLAGKK